MSEFKRPGLPLLLAVLFSAAITCHGFIPHISSNAPRSMTRQRVLMSSAAVETADLVRIFGRLAEEKILLDSSAGACCHSGCDGCPYRYDFDILRSVKPKWIPCYQERNFETEDHTAKWLQIFKSEEKAFASDEDLYSNGQNFESSLTFEDFSSRMLTLSFKTPMGPSTEVRGGEPTQVALQVLWDKITENGSKKLTPSLMAEKLSEWSCGSDYLMWGAFEQVVKKSS